MQKKPVYELEFKDREREFFLAMKRFLSVPSSKYEKLVFSHIWLSCFHFHYCNDPLRTFATCLQISTLNVSVALEKLRTNGYITSKPYMIKT